MPIEFTPYEAPVLDARDEREIVELALARFREMSGLDATDAHSPARALLEAMALSHSELLWRANGLAERFSVLFLQNVGIQQRLGSTAAGTIRIELKVALATSYSIPAGSIATSQGGRKYRTTETVTFAPSELARTVTVESVEIGSAYNLPANAIRGLSTPTPFVASVTNPDPITGGTDAESLEQTRVRGFERIRQRGLIRPKDWELETRTLLGGGIAIAIANLDADTVREDLNTVHVFVANADGSLPSDAQREEVRAALESKALLTIETVVSPCDPNPVWVEAIIVANAGSNPSAIATAIYNRLADYFTVGRYPFGQTVILNEVEARCRVPGVSWVQGATLGITDGLTDAQNLAMKYRWSFPKLEGVRLRISIGDRDYAFSFTPNNS